MRNRRVRGCQEVWTTSGKCRTSKMSAATVVSAACVAACVGCAKLCQLGFCIDDAAGQQLMDMVACEHICLLSCILSTDHSMPEEPLLPL